MTVKTKFDKLDSITTDAFRIKVVLSNLISNAIKFQKPGSRAKPFIEISATETAKGYQISVADNGQGIHQKYKDKIFIIFQRLHSRDKYEGTGIGLAICQKIVQRLGGEIGVKSQEGQGSTFYFTLPKRERQPVQLQ